MSSSVRITLQIVISFRGTQPGEVKDDIADLKIEPVGAFARAYVHTDSTPLY